MIGTTDRGDVSDTLLQAAAVYFNRQEFSKALPLLDRVLGKDSASALARFYLGSQNFYAGGCFAAEPRFGPRTD